MGNQALNPLFDVHGPPAMGRIIQPYALASGGGVAPIDPDDISGLALWLDAQSIVGVDGSAVALWPDGSGNLRDAAQADPGRQPTLQTNELNGLNVVRFNGSSDWMTGSLTLSRPSTVFIVAKDAGAGGVIINLENGPGGVNYTFEGSSRMQFVNRLVSASILESTETFLTWKVFCGIITGSDIEFYVNGVADGTAADAGSFNASGTYILGCFRTSSPFAFLDGDIAEIIVYDSALSTGDRQGIEAYLAAKYAL